MTEAVIDKRESRIRRMFAEIAPWYDVLNHLLSLNIDRYWRWQTVRLVPPISADPILDVCTGTGDLALAYHRACRGKVSIIGADFCHPMVERGKKKAKRRRADAITFLDADAQQLPFPNDTFQITTVAFGLRNVGDPDRGLAEMARVTRPGGRVAVLEFSRPRHWLFGRFYRFYLRHLLPRIGEFCAHSSHRAYEYLPASVMEFPDFEALCDRMRNHGLIDVKYHPFTFGIATLYVGRKNNRH